jgi:hypothetical protein
MVLAVVISGCGAILQAADEKNEQEAQAEFQKFAATLPERGADYGAVPRNYQQIIKDGYRDVLKDPDTALYRDFTQPKRDYMVAVKTHYYNEYGRYTTINPWVTKVTYGYVVCGQVNSKNGYGGYIGYSPFGVLIRNGAIVYSWTGGGECAAPKRVEKSD